MPKFNRRQFLGSTAAAAAFAAAPAIVQAAVVEKKVDLVIVGGGLAGPRQQLFPIRQALLTGIRNERFV